MSDPPVSPATLRNTLFKDGRPPKSITPADMRVEINSLLNYANSPLGTISRQATFDTCVTNLAVWRDFVFGTTATVTGNQIAIRNLTDLNTYFNPVSDVTSVTINSEFQFYPGTFNSTNHAFATDRLNLCAVVDTAGTGSYGGAYATTVRATVGSCVLDGATSCTIANLGWADTSLIAVGTVVQFQFQGLYSVASLVANTSAVFTPIFGSPATATVSSNLNTVTPYRYATTSAIIADPSTTITLSSVPSGVVAGMAVGYLSGTAFTRSFDHRIASIAGNVLTISPAFSGYGPLASGTKLLIGPPITSGQIWTDDMFDLTLQGHVWAFDLQSNTPNNATGGYELRGVNTVAKYNAIDPSAPWGAWPGFWLYSATRAGTYMRDDSEIDILEQLYHTTFGPNVWTGANHNTPIPNVNIFMLGTAGWTNIGFGGLARSTKIEGDVRSSCIVTPDTTLKYIDGQLLRADRFTWTSQSPAQCGVVLAIGSVNAGLNSTMFMPFAAANFPNLKWGVKRLTIYRSP